MMSIQVDVMSCLDDMLGDFWFWFLQGFGFASKDKKHTED